MCDSVPDRDQRPPCSASRSSSSWASLGPLDGRLNRRSSAERRQSLAGRARSPHVPWSEWIGSVRSSGGVCSSYGSCGACGAVSVRGRAQGICRHGNARPRGQADRPHGPPSRGSLPPAGPDCTSCRSIPLTASPFLLEVHQVRATHALCSRSPERRRYLSIGPGTCQEPNNEYAQYRRCFRTV